MIIEIIKLELRTLLMHFDGILQDKFGVDPRWVIVSGHEIHECTWIFRGNADAFLEYVDETRRRIPRWSVRSWPRYLEDRCDLPSSR